MEDCLRTSETPMGLFNIHKGERASYEDRIVLLGLAASYVAANGVGSTDVHAYVCMFYKDENRLKAVVPSQSTLQLPAELQERVAHTLDAAMDNGMKSMLEARLRKTEALMEKQSQASAAAMRQIQDLGANSQALIRQQSATVQRTAEGILKGLETMLGVSEDKLTSLSSGVDVMSAELHRLNLGNLRLRKDEAKSQWHIQQTYVKLEELGSLLGSMSLALNSAQGQRLPVPLCPSPIAGPLDMSLRELGRSISLLFNALKMLAMEFASVYHHGLSCSTCD